MKQEGITEKNEYTKSKHHGVVGVVGVVAEFFISLLKSILESLIVIAIVFGVSTGISAAVCFYYDLPLVLSLIGGFISIGVVYLFKSDSILD